VREQQAAAAAVHKLGIIRSYFFRINAQSILRYGVSGFSIRLAAVVVLLGLGIWAILGPPKPVLTHVSVSRLH
jgi:hypothetical protein